MTEERKYKEVEAGNLWLPDEENQSIEGEVVRRTEGAFGEQVVLKTPNDEEFNIPNHAVLNTKLAGVEVGTWIKIVYLGETKSKKGVGYKDYRVEEEVK